MDKNNYKNSYKDNRNDKGKHDKDKHDEGLVQKITEAVAETLGSSWLARVVEDEQPLLQLSKEGQPAPFTIKLDALLARMANNESEQESILKDFVAKLGRVMDEARNDPSLIGQEERIYPVVRHPSFLKNALAEYVYREHTAETAVLYALDFSQSYTLITEHMLQNAGWSRDQLHTLAIRNLESLNTSFKEDRVGGNRFYFFACKDSYSASRVLLPALLKEMAGKCEGQMGVAVPHQDVLIIADLADAKGASLLSRIAVDFAMRGNVPITPMPFMYEQGGGLELYMVMHHTQSRHKYPIMGGKNKKKK
ncbi:DUF1444 family protein [Aneurinibacillus terranovensis]|uniref:DUF1444 family protein n=1 Tax=Aneurinibacillus terranovensis TaxID=278991 RepID=UPI0003FED7B1|nr:DUF1444 family protein [Aneurinibacillus terranovensis]